MATASCLWPAGPGAGGWAGGAGGPAQMRRFCPRIHRETSQGRFVPHPLPSALPSLLPRTDAIVQDPTSRQHPGLRGAGVAVMWEAPGPAGSWRWKRLGLLQDPSLQPQGPAAH